MEVREENGLLQVKGKRSYPAIPFLETEPYPGFPTDLQSLILAVLLRARGTSRVKENIFESRFRVVEEFQKLGARAVCEGQICTVEGVERLHGAVLQSHELRGGAALILAGLMAEGKTVVSDGCFIRRGYEHIEKDLTALGALISSRKVQRMR